MRRVGRAHRLAAEAVGSPEMVVARSALRRPFAEERLERRPVGRTLELPALRVLPRAVRERPPSGERDVRATGESARLHPEAGQARQRRAVQARPEEAHADDPFKKRVDGPRRIGCLKNERAGLRDDRIPVRVLRLDERDGDASRRRCRDYGHILLEDDAQVPREHRRRILEGARRAGRDDLRPVRRQYDRARGEVLRLGDPLPVCTQFRLQLPDVALAVVTRRESRLHTVRRREAGSLPRHRAGRLHAKRAEGPVRRRAASSAHQQVRHVDGVDAAVGDAVYRRLRAVVVPVRAEASGGVVRRDGIPSVADGVLEHPPLVLVAFGEDVVANQPPPLAPRVCVGDSDHLPGLAVRPVDRKVLGPVPVAHRHADEVVARIFRVRDVVDLVRMLYRRAAEAWHVSLRVPGRQLEVRPFGGCEAELRAARLPAPEGREVAAVAPQAGEYRTAHRASVGHLRRIWLVELRPALAAEAVSGACEEAQPAVARRIYELPAAPAPPRSRKRVYARDGQDLPLPPRLGCDDAHVRDCRKVLLASRKRLVGVRPVESLRLAREGQHLRVNAAFLVVGPVCPRAARRDAELA